MQTTNPDWSAIRDGYIAGVPSTRLAALHGVAASAIRMRASRQGWPTPAKILASAEAIRRGQQVAGVAGALFGVKKSLPTPATATATPQQGGLSHHPSPPPAVALAAEALLSLGEESSVAVARYAAAKIRESIRLDAIPLPSSLNDLATANRIVRLNTGMESGDGAVVNVAVALFGPPGHAPPIVEFEPIEQAACIAEA